ncbi:MAG: DUF2961 domain-containing protein [Melioribacteraceae bacterium]|nr:DUF2961 domain-containing protein [Melioribacteraceae bacterium]MCF8353146.1 DUF2961 domain-containing protein [Melioribacteraceae bacterium]MCF8393154.1 DUF2961 domain-containing protein [Melioribacteraceae bacterium]MCF8418057.1 DUF2961 domain-containing protein [Melioribacteraceae bacterium]
MKEKFLFLALFLLTLTINYAQVDVEDYVDPGSIAKLKNSKLIQISSFDKTGKNKDYISIPPNQNATLMEVEGPGIITRIWITIAAGDPHFLRRILIRMYWDDEQYPSVEVPVGDFFGTGFEYKHHLAQFVGMSSGGYYCYFPMPFNKSAKIEVVNESNYEVNSFYYHVDYQKLEENLNDDIAYFHADWNRNIKTDSGENYTVLEAEGRGHFVGCNLNMQSYSGELWFLEGDEMIYVDGEEFPSVYGTGTEDYLTGGWYFRNGEFNHPYHGLVIKDEELGRISAYRFHVGDAIPFYKSINFTLETGHDNLEVGDYSSTAYWYQMEPHKPFEKILKSGQRIPLQIVMPAGSFEAEKSKVIGSANFKVEDMTDYGVDWSSGKQLVVETDADNNEFEVVIPGLIENKYLVDLYATKSEDYGRFDIFSNDRLLAEYDGNNVNIAPSGKIPLSEISTTDDQLKIKFVSKADKNMIGLDAFYIEPVREFIPEWNLIGPFPNPKNDQFVRYGLDEVYPPEESIDLSAEYEGVDGKKIKWFEYETPEGGQVPLRSISQPSDLVVFYALSYIYSEDDKTYPLLFGSDDGIKIFLNDEQLFALQDIRICLVDEDRIELNLKKGWNKLLLKVENNVGGYGFYARIIDPNNELKYSTTGK